MKNIWNFVIHKNLLNITKRCMNIEIKNIIFQFDIS